MLRNPGGAIDAVILGSDSSDTQFLYNSSGTITGGPLYLEAANTLAQRNGTNAQTLRVYATYTDASNNEYFKIDTTPGSADLTYSANGTGVQRAIRINGADLQFFSANTRRWNIDASGHFLAQTDNTYDIGASGATRPRTGYFGTSLISPILQRTAPVTETNSTHTLAATTTYLICNRAGDVTVTLPSAASFPGREIFIKTIQAQTVTSNASNVVPHTSATAGTAILPATDGAWVLLVSDGTNWISMGGSPLV